MSKKTEATEAKTVTQKKGLAITVDMGCPHCHGKRGHSVSQRKACKSKGPIKDK